MKNMKKLTQLILFPIGVMVFSNMNLCGNALSLDKWNPLKDLEKLIEFKTLQGPYFDLGTMNMYDEKNNIIVEMNVPGVTAADIDVRIEDNCIHVTGKRDERKEQADKDYYRKEMTTGKFERVITLPCAVDETRVVAKLFEGILRIVLPKIEKKDKQATKVHVIHECKE